MRAVASLDGSATHPFTTEVFLPNREQLGRIHAFLLHRFGVVDVALVHFWLKRPHRFAVTVNHVVPEVEVKAVSFDLDDALLRQFKIVLQIHKGAGVGNLVGLEGLRFLAQLVEQRIGVLRKKGSGEEQARNEGQTKGRFVTHGAKLLGWCRA